MENSQENSPSQGQDTFDKDDSDDIKDTNTSEIRQSDGLEAHEEKANHSEEEKIKRDALVEELDKVEAEIRTLRTVLTSKQRRASEIKKALSYNIVNDVKEKVKNLQESEVLLKTNQAFKSAGERTSAAFSNFGKRFGDVKSKIGESIGTSINNVKARVNNGNKSDSVRSSGVKSSSSNAGKISGSVPESKINDEDISLYADLDDSDGPY